MLRVHRFAAAIDMIAAGTNAPIAIAANATPANQSGNSFSKSCGTASCGFGGSPTVTPAAIATNPSSASSPSRKEYAGSSAALRRMTDLLRVEITAVTECGYMNSASADPSASEAYAQCNSGGGIAAFGDAAPLAIASAFSLLNVSKESLAAEKMASQP